MDVRRRRKTKKRRNVQTTSWAASRAISRLAFFFALAAVSAIIAVPDTVFGGPSVSVEQMTQSLISVYIRYQNAPSAEQATLLNELLRVAADREKELAKLMESDPKEVLRLAVSASLRGSMPPSVQAFIEEHVDLGGTMLILHEDRNVGSRYLYFLEAGDKRYTLHFTTEPTTDWLTGSRIRIKGVRIGNDVAL